MLLRRRSTVSLSTFGFLPVVAVGLFVLGGGSAGGAAGAALLSGADVAAANAAGTGEVLVALYLGDAALSAGLSGEDGLGKFLLLGWGGVGWV